MNIADYLISPDGKNWHALLVDWVPPLPPSFNVWLVNRLGEVFAIADQGSVLRLDAGAGTCTEAASSREHFARQLDAGAMADFWLRLKLVDACRQSGMELGPFECYGFKIPPTLGGRYEPANLRPTHLAVHFSYQAYICKQQDVYWIPPA